MSGSYIDLLTLRVRASGAVTRRRFVGFGGAQLNAVGLKGMGVAHHDAVDGEDLRLTVSGTAIVEAGGPLVVGATVVTDAQGRAISGAVMGVLAGAVAVTSAAANGAILTGADTPIFAMGDALTPATAAGQFIEVLLRR
jgi:hypothetical protein